MNRFLFGLSFFLGATASLAQKIEISLLDPDQNIDDFIKQLAQLSQESSPSKPIDLQIKISRVFPKDPAVSATHDPVELPPFLETGPKKSSLPAASFSTDERRRIDSFLTQWNQFTHHPEKKIAFSWTLTGDAVLSFINVIYEKKTPLLNVQGLSLESLSSECHPLVKEQIEKALDEIGKKGLCPDLTDLAHITRGEIPLGPQTKAGIIPHHSEPTDGQPSNRDARSLQIIKLGSTPNLQETGLSPILQRAWAKKKFETTSWEPWRDDEFENADTTNQTNFQDSPPSKEFAVKIQFKTPQKPDAPTSDLSKVSVRVSVNLFGLGATSPIQPVANPETEPQREVVNFSDFIKGPCEKKDAGAKELFPPLIKGPLPQDDEPGDTQNTQESL